MINCLLEEIVLKLRFLHSTGNRHLLSSATLKAKQIQTVAPKIQMLAISFSGKRWQEKPSWWSNPRQDSGFPCSYDNIIHKAKYWAGGKEGWGRSCCGLPPVVEVQLLACHRVHSGIDSKIRDVHIVGMKTTVKEEWYVLIAATVMLFCTDWPSSPSDSIHRCFGK